MINSNSNSNSNIQETLFNIQRAIIEDLRICRDTIHVLPSVLENSAERSFNSGMNDFLPPCGYLKGREMCAFIGYPYVPVHSVEVEIIDL